MIAQPELNSWLLNISGETGYNNQPSNVQSIHYTNSDVYISCLLIPGYENGPCAGNPNQAENQNISFNNPSTQKQVEDDMAITHRWEEEAFYYWQENTNNQLLFGLVQGLSLIHI